MLLFCVQNWSKLKSCAIYGETEPGHRPAPPKLARVALKISDFSLCAPRPPGRKNTQHNMLTNFANFGPKVTDFQRARGETLGRAWSAVTGPGLPFHPPLNNFDVGAPPKQKALHALQTGFHEFLRSITYDWQC